ncbi:protein of unknown function [Enterobacter cancerogenus]|nr:protein of unknown function [Enterobacter cancerogenus]
MSRLPLTLTRRCPVEQPKRRRAATPRCSDAFVECETGQQTWRGLFPDTSVYLARQTINANANDNNYYYHIWIATIIKHVMHNDSLMGKIAGWA